MARAGRLFALLLCRPVLWMTLDSVAAGPGNVGSFWLQPGAIEGIISDLVAHFKMTPGQHESPFVKRLMQRIYFYQDALRPLYTALPKNSNNHLDFKDVGEALHRFFVRKYQMHLRGLAAFGDPSNGTAPASSIEEFVEKAIENQLADNGFTNRELSIFAVALEHLIHEERTGILLKIFEMLSLPSEGAVSQDQAQKALEAYVVFLMVRTDPNAELQITADAFEAGKKVLDAEDNTYWRALLAQLHHDSRITSGKTTMNFSEVKELVEEWEQSLGSSHEAAVCQTRKKAVLSDPAGCDESGRIPRSALRSQGFGESLETLEKEGLLVEPRTAEQHVYFANWLMSSENCHIKTDFYTICCADPCEMILSTIEEKLDSPYIIPKRDQVELIAPLLQTLHASTPKTVDALSALLEHHAGGEEKIEIHGTDFAYFLHYAAPCECPKPASALGRKNMSSDNSGLSQPQQQAQQHQQSKEQPKQLEQQQQTQQPQQPQKQSQQQQQQEQPQTPSAAASIEASKQPQQQPVQQQTQQQPSPPSPPTAASQVQQQAPVEQKGNWFLIFLLVILVLAALVPFVCTQQQAALKPRKLPFQEHGTWSSEQLEMKGVV
eukprot:TRINITY_DN5921_c0_g2_i1.p1 TRINITY_DN5921_c0_g2~~TRINITY_DN5921_c0_g2_i1.p1  ORF type:complete len:614 (-),score=142.03 TRINITY_DN5921_c0_g2_i1:136-1953(-)